MSKYSGMVARLLRARKMAIGAALLLMVSLVVAGAVAYAQTGTGVIPTQPEVPPPPCVGGAVLNNPSVGEYTLDIPGLDGEEVRINVDDPDGWFVSFDSDIPVVRVTIVSSGEGPTCNVYTYETDPLVFSDAGLHAPNYEQPTRIEICFAGGRIVVHKFEDLDRDGVYDQGEPMLQGWNFSLVAYYEGPWPIHSASTGADGTITFPNLAPDTRHAVTETLVPGWISTTGGLTQDNIYVDGGEVTDVWFGNARETAPPTDGGQEEPAEEEEELLPKTGIDPTPLVGGVALLVSAGAVGGLLIRRKR